jgi:hypothetical protein
VGGSGPSNTVPSCSMASAYRGSPCSRCWAALSVYRLGIGTLLYRRPFTLRRPRSFSIAYPKGRHRRQSCWSLQGPGEDSQRTVTLADVKANRRTWR